MKSIRTRLLIGLLAGVFLVQVIVYLMIYARIEDEIDDLFDAELERSALSAYPIAPQTFIPTPQRKVENPQEGMVVIVWQASSGAIIYQSHPQQGIFPSAPRGFSKGTIEGRDWRMFSTTTDGRIIVAAQPADVRDSAAEKIALRTIFPSLVALPFAALMIWMAVSYALRPLRRITADLRKRSHRDLAPIDASRFPPDIAPLAVALNELMQRVSSTIGAQRTFIADATHELLTPLTALRLQAQMLARAKSASRHEETLTELQGGIARTLGLARQLLTLARQDADADVTREARVDLSAVVERSVTIHVPLADEKAVRLELGVPDGLQVRGDEESLAILISNLVENGVKYSGPSGQVTVSLRQETPEIALRIEDSGPGIPVEDRERVFDRFYRRPDTSEYGNGLGLSIARQIAIRHGAEIVLQTSEALGGLLAEVRFREFPLSTEGLIAESAIEYP